MMIQRTKKANSSSSSAFRGSSSKMTSGTSNKRRRSQLMICLFASIFSVFLFVSYSSSFLIRKGIVRDGVEIVSSSSSSSSSTVNNNNSSKGVNVVVSSRIMTSVGVENEQHVDQHSATRIENLIEKNPIQTEGKKLRYNFQQEKTGKKASVTTLGKENEQSKQLVAEQQHTKHGRRLGVFMGIFTSDTPLDQMYRVRQRRLIKIWNDPRVCGLHELKNFTLEQQNQCELVYTFVLGANPNGPTEIVDNSAHIPILSQKRIVSPALDLNNDDVTRLNIKENMNEGKSQTFFYYATQVMEQYDLDYVIKCDADTAIHLHEFFAFAYLNLLTYPDGNPINNVYAGSLRNKAYWPQHPTEEERIRYETYFGNNYEGVHLYIAGQFYVLSKNLVNEVLIPEIPNAHDKKYLEGHEDHDIAAIVFHAHIPLHLITMGRQMRCWEHPVKGEKRWVHILAREQARMNQEVFEGKLLTKDSSYEEVIVYKNSSLIPVYKAE